MAMVRRNVTEMEVEIALRKERWGLLGIPVGLPSVAAMVAASGMRAYKAVAVAAGACLSMECHRTEDDSFVGGCVNRDNKLSASHLSTRSHSHF